MDTGLTLQQLMTAPGAVNVNALLTKKLPQMLPVVCSGLAADPACRCDSAVELLQLLDSSVDDAGNVLKVACNFCQHMA